MWTPTWVSISCFFSLMRDRPEKSMVSMAKVTVSVWMPHPTPTQGLALASIFDLLLA